MRVFFLPALSAVIFCGVLPAGAAPEPEWRRFPEQLEFLNRNLAKQPEFRSAVAAWRRARGEAAAAVLAACRTVPEVRSAWNRLFRSRLRLAAAPGEIERNREVVDAARNLARALSAAPGVARAKKTLADAAARSAELIRRAGGRGEFPPGPALFDGAFDAIGETPVPEVARRIEFLEWLTRKVREEHPGSDARLLPLLIADRKNPLEAARNRAPDGEEPLAEPVDELFRILALLRAKKLSAGAAAMMIEELAPEFGPFTRAFAVGMIRFLPRDRWQAVDSSGIRWELMRLYRDGAVSGADSRAFLCWLEEELSPKEFAALAASGGLNRDEWLAAMVAGRAALNRALAAASAPVSGSGAARKKALAARTAAVRREAEGAKKEFERALTLVPERPEPLEKLLQVGGLAGFSPQEEAALFRALLRRGAGSQEAFRRVAEALLSSSDAPLRRVAELACAAMDSGRIDTTVPLSGFSMLLQPGGRRWDYRWKNIFLQPGVAESGDRLFDYCEAAGIDRAMRNRLLLHRMTFEMATLRYDRALKTRKKIPLKEAQLAALWRSSADGDAATEQIPVLLEFQNPVPLLSLFSGKHGRALSALEREYLRGDRKAPEKLAAWLRANPLPPEERDALIDLFGRWTLPCGLRFYLGRENRKDSFRAALHCGDSRLMAEMLRLGYRCDRLSAWSGESAWLIARQGRDPALLDLLKKAGDPLNRPDPEGYRTPLHMAAVRAGSGMTARLLALGVPCDTPDNWGRTPLAHAAAAGNAEGVIQLLKAGADVNRPARGGVTPLMASIRARRGSAVWKPLLQRTARIDARDRFGRTALHYAAEYSEDPELVKALLARGASTELRDRRERTPAEIAAEHGREKIAALLRR